MVLEYDSMMGLYYNNKLAYSDGPLISHTLHELTEASDDWIIHDFTHLGVVGTKTYNQAADLYHCINSMRTLYPGITTIVSGKAKGADTIGERYAIQNNLQFIGFEAKWEDFNEPCLIKYRTDGKKYNALAGFNRNTTIVNEVDGLIAAWDNKSPGTGDTIEKARNKSKSGLLCLHILEF